MSGFIPKREYDTPVVILKDTFYSYLRLLGEALRASSTLYIGVYTHELKRVWLIADALEAIMTELVEEDKNKPTFIMKRYWHTVVCYCNEGVIRISTNAFDYYKYHAIVVDKEMPEYMQDEFADSEKMMPNVSPFKVADGSYSFSSENNVAVQEMFESQGYKIPKPKQETPGDWLIASMNKRSADWNNRFIHTEEAKKERQKKREEQFEGRYVRKS